LFRENVNFVSGIFFGEKIDILGYDSSLSHNLTPMAQYFCSLEYAITVNPPGG